MYNFFTRKIKIIFFSPFVLFFLIISKFIKIKLFRIQTSRIGGIIYNFGFYFNEKKKIENKNKKIILLFEGKFCNEALKKMIERKINIPLASQKWPLKAINYFFNSLYYYLTALKKEKEFKFSKKKNYGAPIVKLNKPYLSFTNEEIELGQELLIKLGVPRGAKWICIHNRDDVYLKKKYPNFNWKYHYYRDFSINSLIQAAESLTKKNIYIIRVGSSVKEPIRSNNKKIIDYSNSIYQSDFADIYLLANSIGYLGSDSGIHTVSLLFKKPNYIVNFPLTELVNLTHYLKGPILFKRIKYKKTKKLLSLKEILSQRKNFDSKSFYSKNYIFIDNTSNEIKDIAKDIMNFKNKKMNISQKDKKIQNKFWNTYLKYFDKNEIGPFRPFINMKFLKNNLYLLN